MMKKCLTTLDKNVQNFAQEFIFKAYLILNQGHSRDYHTQIKQNTVKGNPPSCSLLGNVPYQLLKLLNIQLCNEKSRNSEIGSKEPHK
jgi:hypothetical protein